MIQNYNHYTEKELGCEMAIYSSSINGKGWWHEAAVRDETGYWAWEFGTDERITLEGLASGKYDTLGSSDGSYKTVDELIRSGISHELASYILFEKF